MITKLIDNIAMRLNGENNLSDITWAFCETSQTFKRLFLSFFFKDIGQYAADIYIEREHLCGNLRVDFFFNHNGQNYIIENKIYDCNQHFGAYDKAFRVKPEQFGYIINYNDFQWKGLSRKKYEENGYQIRTWEAFYDFLEKTKAEEEISEEELQLISYYQTYLINVCDIVKIKQPMRLATLSALPSFFQLLDKKVLYINRENFQTKVYINGRETKFGGNSIYPYPQNCVFGRYFSVTFPAFKRNKESWGWFGIYCNININPIICIGFDNDKSWGKTVYKLIETTINDTDSQWYKEDEMVWTNMNDEEFSMLDKANSIEEQIEIMQDFICNTMESIFNLYINNQQQEDQNKIEISQ